MVKKCAKCKVEKDISIFRPRSGKRSHTFLSWCIECKQSHDRLKVNEKLKDPEFAAQHYLKKKNMVKARKVFVEAYLAAHPCIACGESDIEVLDFDHWDRSEKEYSLGKMYGALKSEKAIMDEIAKCDVLCGNCHRHKTMHENNSWRVKFCSDDNCRWVDASVS